MGAIRMDSPATTAVQTTTTRNSLIYPKHHTKYIFVDVLFKVQQDPLVFLGKKKILKTLRATMNSMADLM